MDETLEGAIHEACVAGIEKARALVECRRPCEVDGARIERLQLRPRRLCRCTRGFGWRRRGSPGRSR